MRLVLFFALMLLVVPAFVSGLDTLSCANNDQIIFSAYMANNSHAALWNDANAGYKICYNQFFGNNYVPANGVDPHACLGSANVLKLSSASNAHVSDINSPSYNTNVCYSGLSCNVRYLNCNPGETSIATLSNTTNAHVANASFSLYQYKLCCIQSGPNPGFNSARWEQSGNAIGGSRLHQNVDLVVQTNFSAGSLVTFEIFEDDSVNDDNIRVGNANLSAVTDSSGNAKVSWYINDSDILNASNAIGDEDASKNNVEFYFQAKSQGKTITSGILSTLKSAGGISSGGCSINIDSINNGAVYFVNTSILFNQSSPSGSTFNWRIDEEGFTSSENSFVKTFTTSGQKTITLIANVPGCADQIDQRAITIIGNGNEQNLFVSKPFAGQVIPLYNRTSVIVDYSANGSYVISSSISGCTGTLTCLAGVCPLTTSNSINGCSGVLPISSGSGSYDSIRFTWSEITRDGEKEAFVDGELGEVSGSKTLYSSSYSRKINDYAFKVNASYSSGSINLQKSFVRNFTLGECLNNGYNFTVEIQGVLSNVAATTNYSSTLSNYDSQACKGIDSLAGTGDDCCPNGYMCSDSNGCVPKPSSAPIRCEDYTTQLSCDADTFGLWRYQSSTQPNVCSSTNNGLSAYCAWSNNSGCGLVTNVQNNAGTTIGSCFEQSRNVSACVNGYYQINVTAVPQGGVSNSCLACNSGLYVAPCGRPAVELPFFSFWNVIVTLVAVVGVYLLTNRKN